MRKGSEMLHNLPKVTQHIRGRVGSVPTSKALPSEWIPDWGVGGWVQPPEPWGPSRSLVLGCGPKTEKTHSWASNSGFAHWPLPHNRLSLEWGVGGMLARIQGAGTRPPLRAGGPSLQPSWSLADTWQGRSEPIWDCRLEWRRDRESKNVRVWGQRGLGPNLVVLTLDMFPNICSISSSTDWG